MICHTCVNPEGSSSGPLARQRIYMFILMRINTR
jgi:hypothetical protein